MDGLAARSGADSFIVMREMAAAGMGRAVLPALLGEQDVRLRRIETNGGDVPPPVPLWVISHEDLAHAPRLRRLRKQIAQALLDRSDWLNPLGAA